MLLLLLLGGAGSCYGGGGGKGRRGDDEVESRGEGVRLAEFLYCDVLSGCPEQVGEDDYGVAVCECYV